MSQMCYSKKRIVFIHYRTAGYALDVQDIRVTKLLVSGIFGAIEPSEDKKSFI